MDGSNGATTFPDSSPNNYAVVSNGVTVSTTAPEFGSGSGLWTAGNYLQVPQAAGELGTVSSWTVELWVKPTQITSQQILFASVTGGGFGLLCVIKADSNVTLTQSGFAAVSAGLIPAANVWTNVTFVMNAGFLTGYINGVAANAPVAYTINTPLPTNFFIGYQPAYGGAFEYTGNMDEFRITLGVARYTSNFTPSAVAFPSVACTVNVPNVIGMTSATAVATLAAAGFVSTIQNQASNVVAGDVVISHNPSAGQFPLAGNVILIVSTGPALVAGFGNGIWGSGGGGITPSSTPEILGHVLADAQQPGNAIYTASQSVAAALSAGTSITQLTPAANVPKTPTIG